MRRTALRRSTLRPLLAVAGAAAVMASALPASASPADVAPRAAAPVKGTCSLYTVAQAASTSPPTPAVDCASPHTALTYFVGTVTGAGARAATPLTVDTVRQAHRACYSAFSTQFRPRVALTRAQYVFFLPTLAQWKAGQRWFRCDVGVLKTPRTYQAIPADFGSRLAAATAVKAYLRCLDSGGATTPCTKAVYRAEKLVSLGAAGSGWPGSSTIKARSISKCRTALKKPKAFWATWPTTVSWEAGARTAVCYRKRGT